MSGNSTPDSVPPSKKRKPSNSDTGKPTSKRGANASSKQSSDTADAESSAGKPLGANFRIPKRQNDNKPGAAVAPVEEKGGRSALPNQGPTGDSWKVSRGMPGGPRGGAWRPRGGRGRGGGNFNAGNNRKASLFPLDEILPLNAPQSRRSAVEGRDRPQAAGRGPRGLDNRRRNFGHRTFGDDSRGSQVIGDQHRDVDDRHRDVDHRDVDDRHRDDRHRDGGDRLQATASPCSNEGGQGQNERLSNDGSKSSSQTDCSRKREVILSRDNAIISHTNTVVGSWIIAVDPHQSQMSSDPDVALKYLHENDIGVDEEVPMEIEDVCGEIQELRGRHASNPENVCGDLTLLSKRGETDATGTTVTDSAFVKVEGIKKGTVSEQIFVVLDTNVLLADLKLVNELMSSRTGENGSAMTILLVPWVVMQELDTLKDDKRNLNPKLQLKARKAVLYLHELLITGHPQLRGQTALQSREDAGISIECNDDRILQCCLQYEKVHKNVVLFTNDRNLCSKAVINCIGVQSNSGIMAALDRLAPPTTSKALPAQVVEDICLANKNYNTLMMEMKTVLRDILSRILETEMRDAYGDLWKSIVLVKPPWRLMDLIKCFIKHWIAVFGQFLGKHAKTQLDVMHLKLKSLASSHNHENLKTLLGASILFVSCFEKRTAYRIQLNDTIRDLRKILEDLKLSRQIKQEKMSIAAAITNGTDRSEAQVRPPAKKTVLDSLSSIWNFINHTSGLLLDSLSMISPITYNRPKTLATENECVIFIPKFFPVLMKLKGLVQGVLLLPTTAPPTQPEYALLCHHLENFYSFLEMDSDAARANLDEDLTPQMMWEFYNDESNRLLLQRGYLQLEDFCTLIYQCSLKIRDKF